MARKLAFCTVVTLVAAATWLLWPRGSYDISKVHASLRQLQTPYRSVWTSFYLDGGTIAIRIVDRDGRKAEFLAPVFNSPRPPRYDHLFVGGLSVNSTNLIRIQDPEHTKQMLVEIIDSHVAAGPERNAVTIGFRGAPTDYLRAYISCVLRR
jgi:hypothetical protein